MQLLLANDLTAAGLLADEFEWIMPTQEQWLRKLTSQGRPVPLKLAHPVPAQTLPAAQLSQRPERLSPGTHSHSETPA